MWAKLVVLTVLGFAQPGGFDSPSLAPAVYRIDGYIDQAPEGETIQYRMTIGNGPKSRLYLITKSVIEGGGDPFTLYRNLGVQKPDYILVGPKDVVDSVMNAKAGAKMSGAFYYRRGQNNLEVDPRSLKIE